MAKRIQIKRQGGVVSDSRNLRGVMDYARRNSVRRWRMTMTENYGADIVMEFFNGATAEFQFAGYDVAQRWIRARRSWALEGVSIRATAEVWEARV